jgi:hypothetical protein
MNHSFTVGQRVVTATGYTAGTVIEAGPDYIDVQADSGYKYRNCKPSTWRDANDPSVNVKQQAKPLEKGERVYTSFKDDEGDTIFANGTVIISPGKDGKAFVTWDHGRRSNWIEARYLIRGENPDA